MKTYRLGVIGLGARGEAFARQLHAGLGRAELFGLCDTDADRTARFLDYCGLKGVSCFADPEEFLAQPGLDGVIVTTPDFTHLDVARLAFRAHKHAYIEKPLEVTAKRCREIMRLHRASRGVAFIGFNMRAEATRARALEILRSGVLGQIVHIEGLEELGVAHGAAFMRRFHRLKRQSGGLLNTKCCHDLDLLQWYIGHEHRVRRVASFGGRSIFLPGKAPAKTCPECPPATYRACPYKDAPGFVFPIHGPQPFHKTRQAETYGGPLCVYNPENELVDNQTVILEWDHGVRGSFNLQLFQREGHREINVWGEKGKLRVEAAGPRQIEVILSWTGEVTRHQLPEARGGHEGTDPLMLGRFLDAIERGSAGDSGLEAGLAATLVAEKALESLESGRVVKIAAEEYAA
jgi:predicted dehydrogenase